MRRFPVKISTIMDNTKEITLARVTAVFEEELTESSSIKYIVFIRIH